MEHLGYTFYNLNYFIYEYHHNSSYLQNENDNIIDISTAILKLTHVDLENLIIGRLTDNSLRILNMCTFIDLYKILVNYGVHYITNTIKYKLFTFCDILTYKNKYISFNKIIAKYFQSLSVPMYTGHCIRPVGLYSNITLSLEKSYKYKP